MSSHRRRQFGKMMLLNGIKAALDAGRQPQLQRLLISHKTKRSRNSNTQLIGLIKLRHCARCQNLLTYLLNNKFTNHPSDLLQQFPTGFLFPLDREPRWLSGKVFQTPSCGWPINIKASGSAKNRARQIKQKAYTLADRLRHFYNSIC